MAFQLLKCANPDCSGEQLLVLSSASYQSCLDKVGTESGLSAFVIEERDGWESSIVSMHPAKVEIIENN